MHSRVVTASKIIKHIFHPGEIRMASGAYELLLKYIASFVVCPIHGGVSRGT
jgi:hypothetical protein